MKVKSPSLLSGTLIYGLGGILQRLISFILLPFYTHLLSTTDYGIISLVGLITISLGALYSLGTTNSAGILYFDNKAGTKEEVIWTTTLLLLLNGSIITIIINFLAPSISSLLIGNTEATLLIRYSAITLLLQTIKEPFYMHLRYSHSAKKYVWLTLTETLVTISLSICLVLVMKRGIVGFFEASLLSSFFSLLLIIIFVALNIPNRVNLKLFKPLIAIGIPSIFGLFAFLIIDYADRKMMEHFLGIEITGIYSIGYNFGMMLIFFVSAFGMAWPQYFFSFKNRLGEAKIVFGNVLRFYIMVFGLIVLCFFWWAKPLTYFMTDQKFHSSYIVIGWIAASYMLKGCYLIFLPSLYFNSKLYFQSFIEWAAAIVNVVSSLLLIPKYGMIGAAASTFVGYLILPSLTFIISKYFIDVRYQWWMIMKNLLVLCILISLAIWSSHRASAITLLYISVPVLSIYILFIYKILLLNNERVIAREFINNLYEKYIA